MIRPARLAVLALALVLSQAPAASLPEHRAGQLQTAGATTLLVQDVAPWATVSNETILASLGVAFDTVGTADFPSVVLSQYSTIIVASNQEPPFYTALNAQGAAIDRWLRKGPRTLEYHASRAERRFVGSTLPGGVRVTSDTQSINALAGNDSPLLAGLPDQMHGAYVSHAAFASSHDAGSSVLMVTVEDTPAPVMVDYCVGPGRVIATGQTVELGVLYGWDFAPVLTNMLTASTLTPGCQN